MTITVNIPPGLEGFLQAKTAEEHTSPEGYLLALVEMNQTEEATAKEALASLGASQREGLESTLEDRLRGPFVPLAEGWKDRVLARATAEGFKSSP